MGIIGDERRSLIVWLDGQGLEPGADLEITPIRGGRSHAMFRLRRGSSTWILRRPTTVALGTAADGLRREFQVLSALAGGLVPHPAPIARCDDAAVIGSAFYLMENVKGVNPTPRLLAAEAPGLTRVAVIDAMTDALAQLHEVDWRSCGWGDFGRPDGFHHRQAERWARQLRSYGGPGFPEAAEVFAWLGENAPKSWRPGLMHGDYHMLNVLVGVDEPARVTGILDWETATIGDPLLDLAGFLEVCRQTYPPADGWPDEEHHRRPVSRHPGAGPRDRPDLLQGPVQLPVVGVARGHLPALHSRSRQTHRPRHRRDGPQDGEPLEGVDRVTPKQSRHQILADALLEDIASGRYRVGGKLPTEAELCEIHQLSRGTVRQALAHLESLGMILRRARAGTTVLAREPENPYLQFVSTRDEIVALVGGRRRYDGRRRRRWWRTRSSRQSSRPSRDLAGSSSRGRGTSAQARASRCAGAISTCAPRRRGGRAGPAGWTPGAGRRAGRPRPRAAPGGPAAAARRGGGRGCGRW